MAPLQRDREKLSRMAQAVRVLIHGLGEDLDREGLRDTPKRVAKALLDCTQGYHQDTSSTLGTALFHEPIVHQGDEGVVIVRDIDFASTSEETLLPFHGRCHVAYRPKNGVVLGLSKLARLTKQYAKRLQTQERLAADIAVALHQSLECHGVAVVLKARHLSNFAVPEERTNACVCGVFAAKGSPQLEELLSLLHLEDLPAESIRTLDLAPWSRPLAHVPSGSAASPDSGVAAPGTPDPSEKDTDGDSDDLLLESQCCCDEMEAAVQQLLLELGENPHRPGLAGSARRYVMSLLASTSGYHHHRMAAAAAQQPQQQQQSVDTPGQAGLGDGSKATGSGGLDACAAGGGCGSCPALAADQMAAARACASCSPSTGIAQSMCTQAWAVEAADEGLRLRAGCCHASGRGSAGHESVSLSVEAAGPLSGAVNLRVPFASQCEHHMLPFYGTLMVSYFPTQGGDSVAAPLPCSAVEQVVSMYTQRLQVQERITHQVADAVAGMLRGAGPAARPSTVSGVPARAVEGEQCTGAEAAQSCVPAGAQSGAPRAASAAQREGDSEEQGSVMVVCDAAHMCMVARGVENHSGSTTSFAVRGAFVDRPELRRAVLRLFREHC